VNTGAPEAIGERESIGANPNGDPFGALVTEGGPSKGLRKMVGAPDVTGRLVSEDGAGGIARGDIDESGGSVAAVGRSIGEINGDSDVIGPPVIGLGKATGKSEVMGGASGGSVAAVGRSIGEIKGVSDVIGLPVIGLGKATGKSEEMGGASGGSVATVGRSIGEINGYSDVEARGAPVRVLTAEVLAGTEGLTVESLYGFAAKE